MAEGDPTAEKTAAPDATAGPSIAARRRSPRREREVLHRRRRALALAGIAGLALVTGIGVGAATRGTGTRSRHTSAPAPVHLRRPSATLAGHRAASPAAVLAREEQEAITRTLTVTPYVRMAGTQHRELALTFDDGPGPYTPQVLRILNRTHTPATFFEVGMEDRYFSRATAQVVASGDPVGDHTEDHKAMSDLSLRAQRHQLLDEASKMGDGGAPFPDMFRPPYGLWNRTTLKLLRGYHMLMVLWSVDTDDWERPGIHAIVGAALHGAHPGAIILMHDGGGDRSQTVAALPRIIRGLRRRGYRLVTVPRLLLDNPAPQRQDVASLKGAGG